MANLPCREQILEAAKLRLAGIAPTVKVERNRTDELGREDIATGWVGLYAEDDTSVPMYCGEDCWTFPLRVQGTVLGTGEDADGALNMLRAQVMQALCPPGDFVLGGLARLIQIDSTGRGEIAGVGVEQFESFVLEASVIYATAEGDPFTFAD